jgi:hypothetical protein
MNQPCDCFICRAYNRAGPPDKEKAAPAKGRPKIKSQERSKQGEGIPKPSFFQALAGGGWTIGPFLMAAPPPPPPPQPTPLILMGPPVSRSAQRRLGIARFVPGIGYAKHACSRCSKRCWLGPKQLALLEAAPDTEVICRTCALREFKAELEDGTFAMTHLGGRGGGYYFQNGKCHGPPEEFRN